MCTALTSMPPLHSVFYRKKDVARSMTKVGKSDERPLHTFFVRIFVQNLKFP